MSEVAILNLAEARWVANQHTVLIVGPTGCGKTYVACALAHSAIRHGYHALYLRGPRILDDLAIARADGRLTRLLASWARVDVLLIDDLVLRPLTPDQAADLLEVIGDRAQLPTIVTSQLPVARWHEALGEGTIADAILDRLLQNAHRIELSGESRRRPETVTTVSAGTAASPEKGTDRPAGPKSSRRSENRAAETAVEAR